MRGEPRITDEGDLEGGSSEQTGRPPGSLQSVGLAHVNEGSESITEGLPLLINERRLSVGGSVQ